MNEMLFPAPAPADASGTARYYSEKYGPLTALPCDVNIDGSALLHTAGGRALPLDRDFFRVVPVLGRPIPCLAPEEAEQIRAAVAEP